MKRVLLLTISSMMIASVAQADHIGIYSDGTASSCTLAPGAGSTATLVLRFTTGSTGVRFRVGFDHAPGSTFLTFNSPFSTVGMLTNDISIAFGNCRPGSVVLGTMTATFAAPGYIEVLPGTGFSSILSASGGCFDPIPATGGKGYIGSSGDCGEVPTAASTWGGVKALYR